MYCKECGENINDKAIICVKCGVPTENNQVLSGCSRVSYVLLAWFIGTLGIHNFYAGYSERGVAQLLITLLFGWLFIPLIFVIIWNIFEMCTVTSDAKGTAFS